MSSQYNVPGSVDAADSSAVIMAYADALADCLDGPPGQTGERFIRTFLTFWDDRKLGPVLVEVFRDSVVSEHGAIRVREFMSARIFKRVAEKRKVRPVYITEAEEMLNVAPLNLNAATAQIWGVVMLRYILEQEPMASASADDLIALIGPTIQRYLDGVSVH